MIPRYRVELVRESGVTYEDMPVCRNTQSAADLMADYFSLLDREHMAVMMLDEKKRVIGISTVAVGALNRCYATPSEIFKVAVVANATSIILGHNHPSGDCEPSEDDVNYTRCVFGAGALLGIPLLDHLIFGEIGWARCWPDDLSEDMEICIQITPNDLSE